MDLLLRWMPGVPLQRSRFMSDNLLGHSPIAANPPVNNVTSSEWQIPTKGDAEVLGVWSASNGKREKLGELRLELQEGQMTLEDAVTPEQNGDDIVIGTEFFDGPNDINSGQVTVYNFDSIGKK
eukprot:scaffold457_cov50-Attheya_sp.AAC.2